MNKNIFKSEYTMEYACENVFLISSREKAKKKRTLKRLRIQVKKRSQTIVQVIRHRGFVGTYLDRCFSRHFRNPFGKQFAHTIHTQETDFHDEKE